MPKPSTTRLPARVERALAQAREVARADRARKGGRWLALIPVTVAVVLFFLLMPRATQPDTVPLPSIDERVTRRIAREDDARADAAEGERLPGDVLAVGSGVRAVNVASTKTDEDARFTARTKLDDALRRLWERKEAGEDLLTLRALQTRRFLEEVSRFEATGAASEELVAIAGPFIERMRDAGWLDERRVLLTETQRRVVYKAMWNGLTGVENAPLFKPTLDEQRALYSLYLQRPHPPESRRAELEAQRRSATDEAACARANDEERRAREGWRIDKIKRLGAIDPAYPTAFALGVAHYRAGQFDLSAQAFRAFLDTHPDGAWSLRARNHLKAALVADGAM